MLCSHYARFRKLQSVWSRTVPHSPHVFDMDPDICGHLRTLCRYACVRTCLQGCAVPYGAVQNHADMNRTVRCLNGP